MGGELVAKDDGPPEGGAYSGKRILTAARSGHRRVLMAKDHGPGGRMGRYLNNRWRAGHDMADVGMDVPGVSAADDDVIDIPAGGRQFRTGAGIAREEYATLVGIEAIHHAGQQRLSVVAPQCSDAPSVGLPGEAGGYVLNGQGIHRRRTRQGAATLLMQNLTCGQIHPRLPVVTEGPIAPQQLVDKGLRRWGP